MRYYHLLYNSLEDPPTFLSIFSVLDGESQHIISTWYHCSLSLFAITIHNSWRLTRFYINVIYRWLKIRWFFCFCFNNSNDNVDSKLFEINKCFIKSVRFCLLYRGKLIQCLFVNMRNSTLFLLKICFGWFLAGRVINVILNKLHELKLF